MITMGRRDEDMTTFLFSFYSYYYKGCLHRVCNSGGVSCGKLGRKDFLGGVFFL
jgi:hypothetical protein